MIPEISSDRAKVIAKALLEVSSQLDAISRQNPLSLGSSSYAQHMILDLIDKILPTERMNYISDFMKIATPNSLQIFANVINMLELGYGRLAANGEERDYKKIITLEELVQLETTFCESIKEILESTSLFDFNEWKMVCYLLECFDTDYAKAYLDEALKNDKNILRYLDNSVTVWTGSGTRYEVNNDYEKYLTEETVLKAIQTQVKAGTIFTLPNKTQNKCAAFFLHAIGKSSYHGNISQTDVDDLLTSWQEK